MNLRAFWFILFFHQCVLKSLPEEEEIESAPEEHEIEMIHESRHRNSKHLNHPKRVRRTNDNPYIREKPCAVMYKNDEPVGILQPYQDSYQLLPIHNDESIPVEIKPIAREQTDDVSKRDASDEVAVRDEENTPYSDEKYPYIFAKFKVDSRVEKENKNMRKRESKSPPLFNERHVNSLRSTLSRIQINDVGAEAELKGILNDMGLIDDSPVEKRAADLAEEEDEDLEHGTNKINLNQFEDDKPKLKRADSLTLSKEPKMVTKQYALLDIPEPKHVNEKQVIEEYMNQHPDQFERHENNKEKRSGEMAEQVERQIKQRLQKIKEEVKNEIEAIKGDDDDEDGEEVEREEDEQQEDEEESKSQRRKRDAISTLVEEETSDLDPILFGDNNLVPYIRRRRSVGINNTPKISIADNHLIVDLNAQFSEHHKKTGDDSILPTTAQRFLTRDLKEIQDADPREKKACKCEGKDCNKCPKTKSLLGTDGSDFVYFDDAPYPIGINREFEDGKYQLDVNPDVYRVTNERSKRDNLVDLLAEHEKDLVAVRERSTRVKRNPPQYQRTLTDMTDEELWGALPQGFDGELVRYKRVKRGK